MEDRLDFFLERHRRFIIETRTARMIQADKLEAMGFTDTAIELRRWANGKKRKTP